MSEDTKTMTTFKLNERETPLIAALRGEDVDAAHSAALRAFLEYDAAHPEAAAAAAAKAHEDFAQQAQDWQQQQAAEVQAAAHVPEAPPAHTSWDDWSAEEYRLAHVHDEPSAAQKFAAYLFGKLALTGCLTRTQLEKEAVGNLLESLVEGLDEAASGMSYGGYADFEAMEECASYGQTRMEDRTNADA